MALGWQLVEVCTTRVSANGTIPFILFCWINWMKVVDVLCTLGSIRLIKWSCIASWNLQIVSLEKLK